MKNNIIFWNSRNPRILRFYAAQVSLIKNDVIITRTVFGISVTDLLSGNIPRSCIPYLTFYFNWFLYFHVYTAIGVVWYATPLALRRCHCFRNDTLNDKLNSSSRKDSLILHPHRCRTTRHDQSRQCNYHVPINIGSSL